MTVKTLTCSEFPICGEKCEFQRQLILMEQYPLLELEASCILKSSFSSLALLKTFAAGRSELPQREMFLGRKHSGFLCLMCLSV